MSIKREIRKPYVKYDNPGLTDFGPGETQQQFRDECNINNILKKFQKTGAMEHANKHSANYGFASGLDFRESMEIVTKAQEMFNDLPSSIRSKFGNSPEAFLDFATNPENAAEMVKLGLAEETRPRTRKEDKETVMDKTDSSTDTKKETSSEE